MTTLDVLLLQIASRRRRQRARLRQVLLRPETPPVAPTAPATADAGLPIIERVLVTADLLRLKLARPAGLVFQPGQALRLAVGGVSRRYSLASAPDEPWLEFFIRLLPGGRMAEQLRQLQVGDRLHVDSAAKGNLVLDDSRSQHLLIATGTGISPFVSMLRHYLPQNRGRFVLLNGASFADELAYQQELMALADRWPQFSYIPAVSRPDDPRNAGWDGERGRVDELLPRLLQAVKLAAPATAAYVCGNPAMVDRVVGLLAAQGFSLRTERYD